MAPPSWTTPDQKAWLLDRMTGFMQLQAEGKLHIFWPADKQPLTPEELALLGVAIKTRRAQIENWFRNQHKKIGTASGSAATAATSSIMQRIFEQNIPKRQHTHKAVEIFQKRNSEKIKEALDEAGYDLLNGDLNSDEENNWVDESADTPAAHAKCKKSKCMCVIDRLWRDAPADEVATVLEEVEEEKKRLQDEEQEPDTLLAHLKFQAEQEKETQQGCAKSPAERQEAIDTLDGVYSEVHKATFLASGWVGMSIFGGPNPRMGGDLTLKIVCFGETPGGNDFEASCGVDFSKNITQPFRDFLRSCFSEGDTAAFALPVHESAVDGRPVERIVPTPTAVEAEKPKKSKSKSQSKSKAKSKSQLKASAMDEQLTRDEVEEDEDEGLPMDNSEHDNNSFAGDNNTDSFTGAANDDMSSNHEDGLAPLWPAGMITASEAAALVERRGAVDPATTVIDPRLLGLGAAAPLPPLIPTPPVLTPPTYPTPRPMFKGAGVTSTSTIAVTTGLQPAISLPVIPATSPIIPLPPVTPAMPASHPPVKPPPAPKKTPAPKKAPAVAKKVSSAAVPEKEVTVAEAAKVAKKTRGRGRPRKTPLTNTTEQTVNTPPAPTPSTAAPGPPPLIFTSTNNNRDRAQQAAAAEKAASEKAAAEAHVAEAVKGWTEHTVNGATVVTLKRSQKPAKLPDGSDVQRAGTKTKPTLDASEVALLAHAAANKKAAGKVMVAKATKRKAAVAESKAAPTKKKRKV
ncbi:hypothetical protein DFH08DRAFT_971870 [Mycena albidolilacea]|uniref:Homeobox domain-containing protein n=1 Tax=Mycena albidolilacea TaxID=1033008 RepID=A0AAD6ZBY2_9AGAR|nr:hypothetical protein DFH08DRAFT_971870 [Mycena albidolilacea]